MKILQKSRKNLYYWLLVAASFLYVCIVLGSLNNTFIIFMIPVTEELGVSRTTFSTLRSLCAITYIFSNASFIWVYKRFGFRKPAAIICMVIAVIFFSYAYCRTMVPFFIGAFLLGLGEAYMNTAGISCLINNWFNSHQGKIMGIVMAGSGLGGSVLSLILTSIMEKRSWRSAMMFSGFLHIAAAAIVFFIMKDHPEEAGLKPFEIRSDPQNSLRKRQYRVWKGAPMEILRRRSYYYLILAFTLITSITTYGAFGVFNAHLQDQGLSVSAAALCYSIMLFGLAAFKIITGIIRDRFGAVIATTICLICDVIGIALLAFASGMFQAVVSAVTLSCGVCLVGFVQPLIALDMFGEEGYSGVLSTSLIMLALGNIIVSPICNVFYDRMGTYTPVLLGLAAMTAACILLFLISARKYRRFRAEIERSESAPVAR